MSDIVQKCCKDKEGIKNFVDHIAFTLDIDQLIIFHKKSVLPILDFVKPAKESNKEKGVKSEEKEEVAEKSIIQIENLSYILKSFDVNRK